MLCIYPNSELPIDFLLGMRLGFWIGFNQNLISLKSAKRNMQSAAVESIVIEAYLEKEVASGRVIGHRHPQKQAVTSTSPGVV